MKGGYVGGAVGLSVATTAGFGSDASPRTGLLGWVRLRRGLWGAKTRFPLDEN